MSPRIEPEEQDFDPDEFDASDLETSYREGLRLFDEADYHEAHEAFERCWLASEGGDADFFKGLIQFAGSFVHLKKKRLRPARVLFLRSTSYLCKYPSPHFALDVGGIIRLARHWAAATETVEPETELLAMQPPPRIAFHQTIVDAPN